MATLSNPFCCIYSCTCAITLICLHVFHFLLHSDSHTKYMESRLNLLWFYPFLSFAIRKSVSPMAQMVINSASLNISTYLDHYDKWHELLLVFFYSIFLGEFTEYNFIFRESIFLLNHKCNKLYITQNKK